MAKAGWSMVYIMIITLVFLCSPLFAQNPINDYFDILDNLSAESIEQIQDNTQILEHLQNLASNPLDINTVETQDLERLQFLNHDEIKSIINYRDSFGPLIDPLELQVIPSLSLTKIQQLLPFIKVGLTRELQDGNKYALFRTTGYIPYRNGFRNRNNKPAAFQGGPLKVLIKYRSYNSRTHSWGVSLEKDAGEKFGFTGQPGFDQMHFHYYKRSRKGLVRTLALGDYRINFGQGLLQYQGFAITKSSNPIMIKRVAPVIQPYSGTGEYYYFRGAAAEIDLNSSFRNFVFVHYKKRDATLRTNKDGSAYFSAFQTSGLHRTVNEHEKRNNIGESIAGHRIQWKKKDWKIGINTMYQRFAFPFKPVTRIDNLHRLTGSQFISHSLDFSGYLSSLHVFGEIATQKYHTPAVTVTGLYSFHPKFDGGILIRRFPAYFAPIFGNAFSARSLPNNESGIYLGLNFHPGHYSKLSFYLDSWKGLWPSFQAHGPTFDQDIFLRYDVARRRKWEAYTQIKFRHRADNLKREFPVYNTVIYNNHLNVRIQFRKINYQHWHWTNRFEGVMVSSENSPVEYGLMSYSDLLWNPIGSWWSIAGRIGYFETDSFVTRIYAYEPDIRYSFSIPFFYGRGWRLVARISRKWRNGLRVEIRTGWTWQPDEEEIGSGHNAVPRSYSQQIKLQVMYEF